MSADEREPPGPRAWRKITEEDAPAVAVAFHIAHPECGEAVNIRKEGSSLFCWCSWCEDLRTYQVTGEQEIE